MHEGLSSELELLLSRRLMPQSCSHGLVGQHSRRTLLEVVEGLLGLRNSCLGLCRREGREDQRARDDSFTVGRGDETSNRYTF